MSWEEANKVMDAGGKVALPEAADREVLMKIDGKYHAMAAEGDPMGNGQSVELTDLYDHIKKRTDWEEVK